MFPYHFQEADPRDSVPADWIERGIDQSVLKHELSSELKEVKEEEVSLTQTSQFSDNLNP